MNNQIQTDRLLETILRKYRWKTIDLPVLSWSDAIMPIAVTLIVIRP
jgi:hypothetical protein